ADDAFLVAFPEHTHHAVGKIEITQLEADGLADADAGSVQGLEQRAVTLRPRTIAGDRTEERFHLRLVERLRDPLRHARRIDLFGRRLDRGAPHLERGWHVTAAAPPPLGRASPDCSPRSGSAAAVRDPRPAGAPLRRRPRTAGADGWAGS